MNYDNNGQNRNNRYTGGGRRSFPDDGNRSGSYSHRRRSDYTQDYYPDGDYSDGYLPSGHSIGNNPDYSGGRGSGYSRGGKQSRPRSGNAGYSRDAGRSRPRSGNTGYSRDLDRSYSGSDRTRYSGSGNGGYSDKISSGRSYQSAYGNEDKDEKLPVSVFIAIGVTVIAVIALIVSISVNSNRSKKNRPTYDGNTASNSEESEAMIVEVPDDDTGEEDDETVSSQPVMQSFVGTWYKTDVAESQKSEFTVTMQYSDSFEFRLEIWNGKESAVINGTAFYTDETHADYLPKTSKKIKITFERGTDYVTITHTSSNSSFGIGSKFEIDGKFTEQEPEYAAASDTSSETAVTYDYNIYKSDAVVKALSKTLNSEDYALYKDMMKNGLKSPIDYERTKDKNGKLVNVDSELNAVKYYAHLSSSGSDMIFICSNNADIYVLFYNSEEIIYYTNDKKYSSKMPASFQAVAKAKDIKPTFR